MNKLTVALPPRLTEDEIAAKNAEHERLQSEWLAAKNSAAAELEKRVRGIPSARFLGASPKPWKGGLMHGVPGVGKTHEAICRLLSTPAGVFVPARELIETAREIEFDREERLAGLRFERAYVAAHLVLDDLGTRRPTEFAVDAVSALIEHRWDCALETIVTTNLNPDALAEVWGDRVLSRMFGFGPIQKLEGKDRRRG